MSRTAAVDSNESRPGPVNRTWAILLISIAGLYLELLLIRWIGTEVRIFAYLQNTILIVCFLGLGIGCFTCRQRIVMRRSLLALLCLTAALSVPLMHEHLGKISLLLSGLGDFVIWEEALDAGLWTGLGRMALGLASAFLLLVVVWEIFVPIGRVLGRLMDDHPRTVWAYSVNVIGSLIGVWLFVALSALSLSPFVWMAFAAAMLLAFVGRGRERWFNLACLAGILGATWFADQRPELMELSWSPYQKLALYENTDPAQQWKGRYVIDVNNTGYQGMVDLSAAGVAANPHITPEMAAVSQYDIPLLMKPQPKNVLIVGAGSGNDVAGALRGGAEHVTAVEIDPVIIDMGRRHHPERPYDSQRVTVVIDDARSFFATTQEKFDLIIFGLLDSHTMTSMTNARLDHYVYTQESLARAASLLTDDGVMSLNFLAQRDFIEDRIHRSLTEVFGQAPLAFCHETDATGWGGVMFFAGNQNAIERALADNPHLAAAIAKWQQERPVAATGTTKVATDDWPYLYLKRPHVPSMYYLMAVLMACLLVYARQRCGGRDWFGKWHASQWHFFFLGAAFLLLEVQNISKASVVLGNTWTVNAVIISGILAMVLLANLIAARVRRIPTALTTVGLIGVCVALYFIDLSTFGFLPYAVKAPLVGALTTLPMLFSGLLFIDSFAKCPDKGQALGANLIGALVGGVLQAATFVIGVKALLLIVAGLYVAALATRPRPAYARDTQRAGAHDAPVDAAAGLFAWLRQRAPSQ